MLVSNPTNSDRYAQTLTADNVKEWKERLSGGLDSVHLSYYPQLLIGEEGAEFIKGCFESLLPGGLFRITLSDLESVMSAYAGGHLSFKRAFEILYSHEHPNPDSFDISKIATALKQAGFATVMVKETDENYDLILFARKNYAETIQPNIDFPGRVFIQSQSYASEDSCGIIGREVLLSLNRRFVSALGFQSMEAPHYADLPDLLKSMIQFNEPSANHDLLFRFGHAENVDFWKKKKSARHNWGYVCHEHTLLPQEWLRPLNEYGELFFISEFCADAARASGANRPLHVMHHGYDPVVFYPRQGPKTRWSDEFVYLFVGRGLQRKGIEEAIQSFSREFSGKSDPVRLVIHVANGLPEMFRTNIRDPRITVIDGAMSREDLGTLYRDADCLVHPSYVEGFGLPVLEAKACGLPVIATDFGGYLDFCNHEDTYLIEGKITPRDRDTPPEVISFWKIPDVDHFSHLLRHVYEDREDREKVALAGHERIHGMTWDQVIRPMLDQLRKYSIQ